MKDYLKRIKKQKGFTLIELLAVIVILALLVLIAVPIVQRVIANAQLNSFKSEVQELAKYLDTAYADYQLNGTFTSDSTDFKITGNPGGTSVDVCATVKGLVSQGYVKKADTSNWNGYIKTSIPLTAGGASTTEYNISNGKFKAVVTIDGTADKKLTPEVGTLTGTVSCP